MSAILYTLIDGKVVEQRANAVDVAHMLENGYCACPKQLLKRKEADANKTGKISNKEIREAAKKSGKTIAQVKKELGL